MTACQLRGGVATYRLFRGLGNGISSLVVERESDRWLASISKLACFGTYPFHRVPVSEFLLWARTHLGRFLPTCLRRRDTCHITRHFVRDSRTPEEILTARNLRYQRIFWCPIHGPHRDRVDRPINAEIPCTLKPTERTGRRFSLKKNRVSIFKQKSRNNSK